MPINMIDIATMAPRSQEASQIQGNHMRSQEHAQQQAGVQFNQHVMHDSKKTVDLEKDEWPEYQYGNPQKRQGNERQRQNARKKKENDKEAPVAHSTSSFDVKI